MKILDKSEKIAKQLWSGKSTHFTFLFIRNRLISIGQNQIGISPEGIKFKNPWYQKHSEIDAIAKIWGKIHIDNRVKLVNIRINGCGKLAMSKPCPACEKVIRSLGIYRIYFTDKFSKFEIM